MSYLSTIHYKRQPGNEDTRNGKVSPLTESTRTLYVISNSTKSPCVDIQDIMIFMIDPGIVHIEEKLKEAQADVDDVASEKTLMSLCYKLKDSAFMKRA